MFNKMQNLFFGDASCVLVRKEEKSSLPSYVSTFLSNFPIISFTKSSLPFPGVTVKSKIKDERNKLCAILPN